MFEMYIQGALIFAIFQIWVVTREKESALKALGDGIDPYITIFICSVLWLPILIFLILSKGGENNG